MNQIQAWYRAQPRAIRVLLTINVAAYVLWLLPLRFIGPIAAFVANHLALNPMFPGVLFEPWQLVTYNFVHLGTGLGGFLHILFNMLWLVWIGRDYEDTHGAARLMAAYLITGVGGGILSVILANLAPSLFGASYIYGASASVIGVITLVAVRYPYKSIALLVIGTVRLIYVVIAFLVLDLLLWSGDVAVSAHLGGALFGFLMAKAEGGGMDLSSWAGVFFRDRTRRRKQTVRTTDEEESMLSRLENWLASRSPEREDEDEPPPKKDKRRSASVYPFRSSGAETQTATESEIDRILDKISEQGYDALTDEEKRILYEASKR